MFRNRLNLLSIIDAIEKIDEDFKMQHSHIEWIKIKNFRNIIENKIKPLKKDILYIINNKAS